MRARRTTVTPGIALLPLRLFLTASWHTSPYFLGSTTGQVTGGPPPTPLGARKVLERKGEIYAIPT